MVGLRCVDLVSLFIRYNRAMRRFTPVQVLTVIARRLEQRAHTLERVGLREYEITILELREFAAMVRRAIEYTNKTGGR
jgi:hypothetical protein